MRQYSCVLIVYFVFCFFFVVFTEFQLLIVREEAYTQKIIMASCGNQSSEKENNVRDTFYDIDACSTTPSSILLKINQPSTVQTPKRPLPVGVMTDRSLVDLILKATGFKPMGVT